MSLTVHGEALELNLKEPSSIGFGIDVDLQVNIFCFLTCREAFMSSSCLTTTLAVGRLFYSLLVSSLSVLDGFMVSRVFNISKLF